MRNDASAVRFLVTVIVGLVVPAGAVFARGGKGTGVHYYLGNDPAQWRTEIQKRPIAGNPAAQSPARLGWSRYIGDYNVTNITRIRAGSDGSTYVAGTRQIVVRFQLGFTGRDEVSVTKLDKSGGIVYQTYLGGKGDDQCLDIAIDGTGNAWVVGHTSSGNFPLRKPVREFPAGGFLAKLDADGTLLFSTYFGVDVSDSVNAVATGAAGNVYVAGETYSVQFPVTPGVFQPTGEADSFAPPLTSTGFVSKLSADGSALLYSTYLGGRRVAGGGGSGWLARAQYDRPIAMAVDLAGAAFVTGISNKLEFPTTPGAFQPAVAGPFVTKLAPDGSRLEFSTGIGIGGDLDKPSGIAVNSEGDVYLTGSTSNAAFPVTPGAFQTAFSGAGRPSPSFRAPPSDAFLVKLDRTGSSLIFSTYLGAPGSDAAQGLAVAEDGSVFLAGYSSEQLVLPAGDPSLPPGTDFVARVDPSGSHVSYSARFPQGAAGRDIALAGPASLRVAGIEGYVLALDLDADPGRAVLALSNAAATRVSGRIVPGEIISIWGQGLGPKEPIGGVVEGGFFTKDLGDTQVFLDEFTAPLLFVSGHQINAVVPYGIAGRWKTRLRVVHQGSATADLELGVVPHAPEIFRNPGGRFAAALNEDGTINSVENPAKPGSIVVFFLTGVGEIYPVPEDGSVGNPPTRVSDALSLDNCCQILYAGAAPGLVAGVDQINFRIPEWVSSDYFFDVLMFMYRSERAVVHVKP